ncbi:hypothetical protein L226DRAFT_575166 [Lentinus tigrinus ALCF2SS1-7]|uniref:SigF-like NTF2-like domain-containing protein n=1 Tax=Lentinus tigrinus ALCF2SS1-6 TaxID=1328759 RepID=A0A5C2RU91_9APHY|nr:hypothetical protein L227DRAFT_567177 [Lentinus tigrinus ALCF2SS1-6]RPD70067.1 hypothetical protein L226DRAFT_575166 [Lentinus tigrinus ALCF2SS1-7]
MEDPVKEIPIVLKLVTATPRSRRPLSSNIGFRHPFCAVLSAPDSRDAMLSVLQWYRILSPVIRGDVNGVTYDKEKNSIFLDVTQTFHIRWSPLKPAPARLVIHLTLRPIPAPSDPSKTLYLIAEQEDFYHPDDLAALLVPPLVPVMRLALQATTFACKVNARVFGALGYWRVKDGEGGQGVTLRPEGEPLPPVGENEEWELKAKKND